MTAELARALFFIIWGAGLAVWTLSLRHCLSFLRLDDDFEEMWGDGRPGRSDPGLVKGEADVSVSPGVLQEELARRLPAALGSTFVLQHKREGLELTNALPPAWRQVGWSNVRRVLVAMRSIGVSRGQVAYELDLRPLRRRLGRIGLVVVLAAGLPTLLLVGGLIWFLVIPSTVPAVRWQVLQTLQVSHALWPPFLVTSRLAANVREARTSLHALIDAAGGAAGG